jgi:hypothetical protein
MDIKEFLRENPLIRPSSIEKALGIPHGTIRLNNERGIPEKYQRLIIESLSNYTAIKEHVVVKEVTPIPVKMGKEYVVKRVTRLGIGEHAYFIGKHDGALFKRENDIEDGSVVILKE